MTIEQLSGSFAIAVFLLLIITALYTRAIHRALQEDLSSESRVPRSALGVPSPNPEPETRNPEPETVTPRCEHRWAIAAREETAGRSWAIYRCQICSALEAREVA